MLGEVLRLISMAVNWIAIAVVFACVLFADIFPLSTNSYAFQRLVLVGLLGLVITILSAALAYLYSWVALARVWPAVLIAGGLVILALPFSGAIYVWVEPGMYASYFLGFTLLGCFIRSEGQTQGWVVGLVNIATAAVALYGCVAIMVYTFALSDQVIDLSRYIPLGFVNIRYWSHVATWLLPLLPLAVLVGPLKNERLWRFFVALGAALWWWMEFLSTSRGSVIGIAFGVVFAAILIGRPALPWLRVFLRYLAYGVLVWLLLSVIIPSIFMDEVSVRALKAHASGRVPLYLEAWRMSLENFPFGMGPQSWLTHEVLTEEYRQSRKFGHPHNMYLMWAAEYGWLLIGALMLLVGQAVRLFWQRRAEARSTGEGGLALPLAAFTASVSAALLHAGVSAVFIAPGSMLIGFLVLSVFWALIAPDLLPVTQKKHLGDRFLAAAMVAVVVGVLCFYWLSEVSAYHAAMESDLEFYNDEVRAGTLPRFWFHGNFPRNPSQMP